MRVALVAVALLLALAPVSPSSVATPSAEELWNLATTYFEPLPAVAENPANPVTEAKVELGRTLFFDTRLSVNQNVSCNSCHSLAIFGVDALPTSPGDAGQLGDRNSPTVLNAALHGSQFWDGRAADVEDQAGMPILNPVEMGIPSEQFLVDRLVGVAGYPERFRAAFPQDDPALTYANIRRALAAFERTLLTPSPFDAYLLGDRAALDGDQQAGLRLFLDLGCASCHNGVNVGASSFRKFGLNDSYWVHTRSKKIDEGRAKLTGDEEDRYVFRVASLRNVAVTGPYFHDGSVAELDEALKIMVRLQIGVDLEPAQLGQLRAFMESLTGRLD
jgi:cytochrome c peroxidase